MLELRQTELSVFYHIKDSLDTNGYGSAGYHSGELVTLRDAYPNQDELDKVVAPSMARLPDVDIVLPIVIVEHVLQIPRDIELGSKPGTARAFVITVLGHEKGITSDIAQSIYTLLLDEDIPLNNYNAGFPPTVTPTQVGIMAVEQPELTPIINAGSPNVAERNRIEVTFNGVLYGTPVF